jgi:hypothetical protein
MTGAKTLSRAHVQESPDWEIWLELVLVREGCESVEADSSAHLGVGGSGAANDKSLMFGDPRLRLCCHDDSPFTAPCSLV